MGSTTASQVATDLRLTSALVRKQFVAEFAAHLALFYNGTWLNRLPVLAMRHFIQRDNPNCLQLP
jgi:hypothetical protein